MANPNQEDFEDAMNAPGAQVLRVGVRVPPFWPDDPALWFAQVESQFTLSRITTDDTKFCYVVGQLDHQYAAEVKDVITTPPATGKYDKLKAELIKRLSDSQQKRVKQLLMHEELGDRKPSQFLRHLEGLAGPTVPKDFMTTLWSSRLPQSIQTVVASQTDLSLEKLAELADKVHEIAPPIPHVAEINPSSSSSPAYDLLTKQISALTRQVASLSAQVKKQDRNRGRSRSPPRYRKYDRSRSRSRPKQPPPNHPHCFYHFTYGANAKKCTQPCTYLAENSKGGRK